MLTVPKGL